MVHDNEDEEMKDHADVLAAEQKEQSAAAGTSSPFATTTSDGTKDQPNINAAALEEQVGDDLCSVPPKGNDVGTKTVTNLSTSPTTEGGANKQTKVITSPPVNFANNSIPRKSPQKPLNNKAFKKLKRNKKINVAESSDEEEVEKNADKTPVLATLNNGGAKKTSKMNDKNAVLNLDHSDNEEEMKTKTSSDEKAHHPSYHL